MCHYGCGKNDISTGFVERLQVLKEYLEKCERGCKYVIVNSGCRCPKHSIAVGGFENDMHVMGRAADIHCIDNDDKFYVILFLGSKLVILLQKEILKN